MFSMTDLRRRRGCGVRPCRERGFSLVELMIASTIGLLILSAMVSVFVSTVQSRNELDKSNQQIENGRFAMEMLREDIQLAGFYGSYLPPQPPTYVAPPDPVPATPWTIPTAPDGVCTTILDNMGFVTSVGPPATYNVPVGIYGVPDTGATPACLPNRKDGTDILVIRRTSTTELNIDADANGAMDANVTKEDGSTGVSVASLGSGHYLQVSNCSDTPAERAYVLAKDPTGFILHGVKPAGSPASCVDAEAGLAPVRQYFVHIYYIATCNDCTITPVYPCTLGDCIPTLKMVELTPGTGVCTATATDSCGSMTLRPIAEGIENLQFEYGIDSNLDGTPELYSTAPADYDWQYVTAVKIFLLARNSEISADYTDTKTYSLASDGSTLPAFWGLDRNYKRHVYVATVRAINIANRR